MLPFIFGSFREKFNLSESVKIFKDLTEHVFNLGTEGLSVNKKSPVGLIFTNNLSVFLVFLRFYLHLIIKSLLKNNISPVV